MRKKRETFRLDLTGRRFGRLVVRAKCPGRNEYKQILWECICDCGTRRNVIAMSLTSGRTRSCGCLLRDVKSTHRMENTRVYKSWVSMRSRCRNPRSQQWANYGGRGITVCERWKKFENFYADMGDRPEGMTLDRIDFNKGYSPENCRWATTVQQVRNRRNTLRLTWRGEEKSHAEWAEITGLPISVIGSRMRSGWTVDRALTERFHQRGPVECPHGHPYTKGNYSLGSYGAKVCLVCKREKTRARRAAMRP